MATILVVDDDDGVRGLVCEVLKSGGHAVVELTDGQKAVDSLGLTPGIAQSVKPDLIVMDIMMPGMDGFTAHNQLQHAPHTRRIPLLILSSKAGMKESFQSSTNVASFMEKPFKAADLLAKVKELLAAKGKS